jgi:hypothetical protein
MIIMNQHLRYPTILPLKTSLSKLSIGLSQDENKIVQIRNI